MSRPKGPTFKEWYYANHERELERARRYKKAHREELNQKLREWHALNSDKRSEYHRRGNEILRGLVFDHYGWVCVGCGENDPDVLTIDHVDGDGKRHRATISGTLYQWLKNNNFPSGFRTLCWNCNSGRHARGIPLPNERKEKAS